MKKEIHKGNIIAFVECIDLEDNLYGDGVHVNGEFLKKHGLNVGDKVQYKLLKHRDVEIVGK